ncbi:MAG: alkaline phosphatase family protein, partial [bacterium]
RRNVGPYHIHLASPVGRRRDDRRYLRDILAEDENRTELGLYLMRRHPTDLFMVVYNNIDRIQHQTLSRSVSEELQSRTLRSPEAELVAKVYEETDAKVGRILSQIDEDTLLMIMSDHGAGPMEKVFFLNRWLEENGWLAFKEPSKKSLYHSVRKARTLSKRFLPRWGKNLIKSRIPGLRDRIESYLAFSEVDWERTKAYGFGMYGNIRINLRGREPGGIVEPGSEYEALRSKIGERLESLRDPDLDDKVVDRVVKREQIYHGPYVDRAPDLLVQWKGYSYYTSVRSDPTRHGLFGPCDHIDSSEYRHVGTHRLEGIFMAAGGGIREGGRIEGTEIGDLAPTLLYFLGQPVPRDMDGRVLKEMFTPDFWAQNRLKLCEPLPDDDESSRPSVPYPQAEASQVCQRLKGLGYLE